ncbi:MAG: hypothetical protein HYZ43_04330 [Flavobacteriia bacterium]|nr:hypothetical protein [Flavobacteriia bacterium]
MEEFPIYVYSQWNKLNWIVFPNDTLQFWSVGKPVYSYKDEDKLLEITNYHTAAAFAYLSSPESPRKPIQLSQQLLDFASSTKQQLSHTQLKKWFPYYFSKVDSNLRAICYYADMDDDGTDELIVDLVHPKVVYRYYSVKRGSDYFLTAKSVLYHEFSCELLSKDPHPESGLVWVNEYSSSSCGGYCVLTGMRFHKGKVVRIGGFVIDQYLDSSCAMEEDENTVWELKSSVKSQTRNQVIVTARYSEYTYNNNTPKKKTYLFKNKKIDLVFNWNPTKSEYEWDNSLWPWVKDLPVEASEFSQLVHKR